MAQYRFVIADDHPLFRGALRLAISAEFPDVEIVEAGSLDDVTGILDGDGDVDLVLLDLAMPGVRGFSGLIYLRAQYAAVPVIIVSATEDALTIRRSIELGAAGFVPKSLGPDSIRSALQSVLDGGVWVPPGVDMKGSESDEGVKLAKRLATLTPQQVRVLMMLSEGLLNKQIAYELTVSEATVKAHVSAILTKLGVESRTQAVIAASKIEAGQWQGLAG
jgi:DNA-binding NarL/FixJ family response regulator